MGKLKVVIAAGGSGGHLFPAQQLKEKLKDAEVVFAGYKLSKSAFFEKEKIPFFEIAASPLSWGFLAKSWKGFWQAFRFLRKFQPDVVVGFGSFHTFPVLAAAVLLRKKLILFEANCSLGRVNRLFAPFAKKIAGQFLSKGELVPLLPWSEPKKESREEARKYFGLCPETFTILIFGGSQGASFLNEVMPEVTKRLKGIQVIHLCGKSTVVHEVPNCVKPFEKEMAKAYAAADMAVCRAGAGTIAELIRYCTPALCIPFPHATEDHQRQNGEFFESIVGGGRMLLQQEATVEKIVQEMEELRKKREEYREALVAYERESEGRIKMEELVERVGR